MYLSFSSGVISSCELPGNIYPYPPGSIHWSYYTLYMFAAKNRSILIMNDRQISKYSTVKFFHHLIKDRTSHSSFNHRPGLYWQITINAIYCCFGLYLHVALGCPSECIRKVHYALMSTLIYVINLSILIWIFSWVTSLKQEKLCGSLSTSEIPLKAVGRIDWSLAKATQHSTNHAYSVAPAQHVKVNVKLNVKWTHSVSSLRSINTRNAWASNPFEGENIYSWFVDYVKYSISFLKK